MKKILFSISLLFASLLFSTHIYAQTTMPEISTEDNEIWYYIQFNKGKAVLEDFGEAVPLTTQNVSLINEEQHWKVIEAATPSGEYKYQIVSAKGHSLCYSSSFITSKTSTPALFSILNSTATNYPGLVLKSNGGYVNQKGGETFGKILERGASIAAVGSSLTFIPVELMEEPPAPEKPKVSSKDDSNETWYYIQFIRTSSASLIPVLEDMGNAAKLMTKNAVKNKDEQLWKLIETASPSGEYKYELVNKSGRKIAYDTNLSRYIASSSSTVKLKLTEVATDLAIQRSGGGNNGMNQSGGAGPNRELCDYGYSDQGSICNFITPEKMWGITDMPTITPEKRTKISMENRILTINGENVCLVTIYQLTGQVLYSATDSFSFKLPDSGIYILSVQYNDQITETIKIAVN